MREHVDSFTAHHFAGDGESLGSRDFEIAQLSNRWLEVCTALLADSGPIFDRGMGSTLDRYQIKCTAGIVEFSVAGAPALFAVIVPAAPSEHSAALLNTFIAQVGALAKELCPDVASFQRALGAVPERPALVVVNWLNAEIPGVDQEAIFQLAIHFAGAYLRWFEVLPFAAADGLAAR